MNQREFNFITFNVLIFMILASLKLSGVLTLSWWGVTLPLTIWTIPITIIFTCAYLVWWAYGLPEQIKRKIKQLKRK